jgi:large subunit ribosomal protein L21
MFAIIETGSKQYKVSVGDTIYVEKLEVAEGSNVDLDKVLMIDSKIGAPYISGAKVVAQVAKQVKGDKIMIVKHISQKHHTKTAVHRQRLTKLVIKDIIK